MANDYIYTGRQSPTPQEFQRWAEQAMLFEYHPPDQFDPREWGVPPQIKAPIDCVEQVLGLFKREIGCVTVQRLGYRDPLDEPKIIPLAKFHIVMACHAHFAWFRTREGARYVMSLQGVEEVEPFSEGYVYYYVGNGKRSEISERTGMKLRIFQTRSKNYEPPIAGAGNASTAIIEQMRALLARLRSPMGDPNATDWQASEGIYRWVSGKIHTWLAEPRIDSDFPYQKANRISGPQWIKTAQRSDGQLLYNAIGQVEAFRDRAYRLEDASGASFWCGGKQIDHFGKVEVARNEGMPEDHVSQLWRCDSCQQVRTCTAYISVANGQQVKHCKHCIGHFVEKDTRPSLDWCTYRECKGSPDYIRNQDELVQIKSRLNQGVRLPVQRG